MEERGWKCAIRDEKTVRSHTVFISLVVHPVADQDMHLVLRFEPLEDGPACVRYVEVSPTESGRKMTNLAGPYVVSAFAPTAADYHFEKFEQIVATRGEQFGEGKSS